MTDSNLTVGRRRFIQTTGLLTTLGGFTAVGSASGEGTDYNVSFVRDTSHSDAGGVLDEQLGTDNYEITDHIERLDITEITVTNGDSVSETVDTIEAHDRVDYAEEHIEPEIPDEPSGPSLSPAEVEEETYSGDPNISYGLEIINGPTAWETTEGSLDVTLAVLDSKVQWTHPDLSDRFESDKGGSYTENDPGDVSFDVHGTHVSGCAAATTGNSLGVAGASDSQLLTYRLFGGSSVTRDIADAVEAGADVINCSFGFISYSETDEGELVWDEPRAVQEAFDDARASGTTVFAAAGNDRDDPTVPDTVAYPAKWDSVIAVGATDSSDSVVEFSNRGAVDIVAPGADILSTVPDDQYQRISGTSMASPIAAGVGALLLDVDPELTPDDVERILEETAVDIDPDLSGTDDGVTETDLVGSGRIDAAAAVERAGGGSGKTLRIEDPDGEEDGFERDYEFGVTGSLEPTDSVNDHDSVDDASATGHVDGGTDEYTYTGDLEYFGSKGAELSIDGESVDPGRVAERRTIIIDETTDATVSYEFEVGGSAENGAYAGGGPDSIDGTTISGEVNSYQDSFRYTGDVSDWTARGDGEVTVYIDGEEASFGVTDASAGFEQDVYVGTVGDTADVTVELTNTDTATVQFGDADDVGYYVAGEVSDTDGDGSVTVAFDSAAAGTDQTVLSAPESGGEVSKVTQGGFDGTDSLDPADYPLRVRAGEKTGDSLAESDADDQGTLSLEEAEQSPYNGPHELPGRVQAEDFDTGGQGVAYNDTEAENRGGAYRDTEVDIGEATEGGYFVGWIEAGEWWEYTVEVTEAGTYPVEALVASDVDGGSFTVEVDGESVSTSFDDTGGWQSWTTVSVGELELEAGETVVRITSEEKLWNLNWFEVVGDSDGGSVDVESGVYELHNVETNRVADVAYNSQDDGANVIQYADWNDENQRFRLSSDDDAYTLTAQHSDKYLTASDGNVVQDGGEDPSDSQRWTFESADTGYVVKNVANGEVMTVEDPGDRWGGNIGTAADDGVATQQWELVEV